MDNDEVQGIALPIAGKGLWSTIYGYIALNPDTDSVLGIQFYKHGETPGLGGEVEKKWFTDNFVNHPSKQPNGEIQYIPKKIRDKSGKIVSIKVVKGGVDYSESNTSSIHQVDGISGATVTADGVTDFLLEDLLRYEKTLDKIRDYGTI
jgi:Na+-transporting NADH:ubiquinone oxidoreductase subunit C